MENGLGSRISLALSIVNASANLSLDDDGFSSAANYLLLWVVTVFVC